jgi:kinesin family protein 13
MMLLTVYKRFLTHSLFVVPGKSWSMMGSSDQGDSAGLIPRISNELFHQSELRSHEDTNKSYQLECSYIEIYSEKIRDLLNPVKISSNGGPAKKAELKVREDPVTGPYVEGLSTFAVANYSELLKLIRLGNSERTVAATNMNSESSRSHAIFQIKFTQSEKDSATGLSAERKSTINLVDLAGSERAGKNPNNNPKRKTKERKIIQLG